MFQVVADYPASAAFGACFLTRASKGTVEEIDAESGETRQRPERIITTGRYSDFEGDICLSEKVVRHLAHLLDMVDGWRVERMAVEYEATATELVRMSELNARLLGENAGLRERIGVGPLAKVFVAADSTEHASLRAATQASRAATGRGLSGRDSLAPISATEAPAPRPTEPVR